MNVLYLYSLSFLCNEFVIYIYILCWICNLYFFMFAGLIVMLIKSWIKNIRDVFLWVLITMNIYFEVVSIIFFFFLVLYILSVALYFQNKFKKLKLVNFFFKKKYFQISSLPICGYRIITTWTRTVKKWGKCDGRHLKMIFTFCRCGYRYCK
jgi:hypothetical protein